MNRKEVQEEVEFVAKGFVRLAGMKHNIIVKSCCTHGQNSLDEVHPLVGDELEEKRSCEVNAPDKIASIGEFRGCSTSTIHNWF